VEAAAKEEIKEIIRHKEAFELKLAKIEAQRLKEEKEREDMGVMWGIGECCYSDILIPLRTMRFR